MNRTLLSASVCAALAAFGPGFRAETSLGLGWRAALSQPAPQPAPQPTPGYGGVTPGTGNVPEGFDATPGSTPLVTWPGFQMTPDGGSRVFVQTTVEVKPQLKRNARGFVLLIPGVKLPPSNARRPLDTHFFKTPVQSVHMKQRADGVAVTIQVRGQTDPKLRTEKAPSGYFFTYVEFAP